MAIEDDKAFTEFKNNLLNPHVDGDVVESVLDEKAIEILNVATVKHGLDSIRHYFENARFKEEFFTNTTQMFGGKYKTCTIYQTSVVAPVVICMALDIDENITVGDMGECQIHIQLQPFVMADGTITNSSKRVNKQFNKDEQKRMSPMHWVNRAINTRRSVYAAAHHFDVLDPHPLFEEILAAVRRFLDTVRLGEAPIFKEAPPKEPKFIITTPCSNFVLSVVLRGKMIFTIRF